MISAPTSSLAILVSLMIIGVSGCVIGDIVITDRRCPCTTGWVCDEASDRCVEAVVADAGDALPDADIVDAYVPVDAPPPRPFCETVSDAIFCDDFENGDLMTRWAIEPATGEGIAASEDAAHSGTHGLRLSTDSGSGVLRLAVPIETKDIVGALHFQAWFRVRTGTTGTLSIFELFAGDEGSVSAQLLPSSKAFRVRIADAGTEGVSDDSGTRWSFDEWKCVRGVVVRGEDLMGEVTILDGPTPQLATLDERDTDWGRPYDRFKITLEGGEAGTQIDLDDIVWTRTERACP